MSLKGLHFSYNKFKTDVQSQIAKNNPMQKQDTKSLSMWIFQERSDLATMRTMAYQRKETVKALKDWVKEEVEEEKTENGRDLEDLVGDKLTRLLEKQIEVEQDYANKFQQYRHAVKSIRDREEKLSDAREKKRSLQSRITNLNKTSPRSPKLAEFQKELKSLAHDTHESELDLADFKRFALKEAFYLRFNAMHEYAEKTALIAAFGKYLTDLIQIDPTPPTQTHRNPYDKGPEAAIIFADAMTALENWKPMAEDERATLANNTELIGKGKEPEATAPELPPRQATVELDQPTGYTTTEVSQVTGDLKTAHETEIDLDKIDLYDAPPPAYDDPPPAHASPLNADQQLQPSYSFSSPYQTNSTLPPAPQPQHQQYHHQVFDSPAPMHQQLSPYPQHQYLHQDSTFYDPTNMMYNTQVNYQQLYRHVSQRRQQPAYRPYAEFQQQLNIRQDAGGFRIPAPAPESAEDEKEKLAQYYRQQEEQQYQQQQYQYQQQYHQPSQYQQHYDQQSQYAGSYYGGSQYTPSHYGGSQYGGSQYGGLAQEYPPQQLQSQNSIQKPMLSPQPSTHDSNQEEPVAREQTSVQEEQPTVEIHKPNYEQKTQEE